MIPTNKSESKHLKIKGISSARKTDKNSSEKTRKSNELQTGNRRNHESFHSLGGQIFYKRKKNLTLESKEVRSSPEGGSYGPILHPALKTVPLSEGTAPEL
jgi:hypothetical protein